MTFDQLESFAANHRLAGRRVVLCHGCFDLFHVGHLLHFEAARELGDVLIVTVTPDAFVNKGPGRPAFGQDHRLHMIEALRVVDAAAINLWPTAVDTILRLRPAVFAKGPDYKDAIHDAGSPVAAERRAVESVGGKIICTPTPKESSSTLLRTLTDIP